MTAPLPLPNLLCFALYSANHAMQAAYKPLLDAAGLTYPQFLVLTLLWEKDGQTMSRVGAALQLESNTLTPMLKRMEQAGLLTRQRDPQDERQILLHLTPHSETLRQKAATFPLCIAEKARITAAEAQSLRETILALRNALRAAEAQA